MTTLAIVGLLTACVPLLVLGLKWYLSRPKDSPEESKRNEIDTAIADEDDKSVNDLLQGALDRNPLPPDATAPPGVRDPKSGGDTG